MSREFFDNRMSPETLAEQIIFEASKRAKERIDHERIDPREFKDLYPDAVIDKDLHTVSGLEAKFEQDNNPEAHKLALILEEIFSEQIELNEWLGPGVTTKKASRYDDFVNGVDEIVEVEDEASINHLAVAIDVTFGTSLNRKFQRIREEIESGELASVKYFENSEKTFKGKLSKVPRVVIGTDKACIVELARIWVEHNNHDLASHPVQLEILDEMLIQLEAFRNYAEKLGKEDIVKIYDRQILIVKKIRSSESKQVLRKKADLSYRQEDRVYAAIKQGAEGFAAY